jgi:asparagine synthase (glutamine-hydrolysing)
MCAIVGKLNFAGGVDPAVVEKMRDTMIHRGPDDAGIYVNDQRTVGLAHRRLSIIDLSAAGHQPMTNEDGSVWLVFNGEIYNFQQLRKELVAAGHTFHSHTDSEVIIHGYEEWGPECIKRFRGMFAYVLWDEKLQRLVLGRDRVGIKPLFYWHERDKFAFASELKALRADPSIPAIMDESAAYDFFTYRYVPTPKTIYRDIKKLPPGHYAIFDREGLKITQYWDIDFAHSTNRTESDAILLIHEKLKESIDLHLIADVPVGVMLSGGLDSTTLCAMASLARSEPMHTFSIGFDIESHNETASARLVADRYKSLHHERTVTKAIADELQESVLRLYDEPYADSSAIPTFVVSELARSQVTVALSGEGGDEIFGGYSWYNFWLKFSKYDSVPLSARRLLSLPLLHMPKGFKGKWTAEHIALDPIDRYAKLISGFGKQERKQLLSPSFQDRFRDYDDYWHFRRYWRDDLDPFSRMQYLDIKTYLNDDILTKVDRASMATSIEARVPLLDHELMESVASLPIAVRNKDHQQKYLFRKTVAQYLPPEILARGKKGFSIPLHEWLRSPTRKDLEPICDNDFIRPQVLEPGQVTGTDLWPFLVMGRWLRAHA